MSGTDAAVFVAGRYGARASAPVFVGAGAWSRAYAFDLDGRASIIRFGAHAEDFAKDAAMGGLAGADLPVPQVTDAGPAGDEHFAVSLRCPGEHLDSVDADSMRSLLPALISTLDAIRAVDISGSTGFGIWTADRRAPHPTWAEALLSVQDDKPRIGNWRRALERSAVGVATFDAGVVRLRELTADLPEALSGDRRLIHADLLNRNVLVAGGAVTGVLDWGNSMYGDALYDTAWLIHWWSWFAAWSSIDIRSALIRHWREHDPAPDTIDVRLLACELHIGLDGLAYTASRGTQVSDVVRCERQVRALLS